MQSSVTFSDSGMGIATVYGGVGHHIDELSDENLVIFFKVGLLRPLVSHPCVFASKACDSHPSSSSQPSNLPSEPV